MSSSSHDDLLKIPEGSRDQTGKPIYPAPTSSEAKYWCGRAKEAEYRLEKARKLIEDLVGHEGAEGFSEHTYKMLDEWFAAEKGE